MAWDQRDQRTEFITSLIQQVSDIPVDQVVGRVVDLVPKGQYYLGLCPFHPDNHLGSFVVTPSLGLWRCFADNIGGTGIRFEMEYYKIPFLKAVFKLALDFGIITHETYVKYGNKKYDQDAVEHLQRRLEEPKKITHVKADADVIASVYGAIPKVCQLSKAHEQHLREERHLSDEDMQDYFTFPTRRANLFSKVYLHLGDEMAEKKYGKPLGECSEEEMQEIDKSLSRIHGQFANVPGFYKERSTGKISFSSYKGIGFLVRDDRGMPTGIQIRRDTVKPGESRYIWFSSGFAETKPELEGGAPSGSPGGVIYPHREDMDRAAICITEGRFKAQKIADKGNIAVYVSGVSTWKNVIPMLRRLKGNRKRAFVMFDADMMGNVAVHKQMSDLAAGLEAIGLSPRLIIWSESLGKGFDDLVNNTGAAYAGYLRQVAIADFEKSYQEALREVLEKGGYESVRDVKAEEADVFKADMQEAVETRLSCPRKPAIKTA